MRADRYQARQDDDTEWGEPLPAPAARRRLDSMLSVRLAPREVDAVRAAAERLGLSVSAFLRRAALQEAEPPVNVRPVAAPPQPVVDLFFTAPPMTGDPVHAGASGILIPSH
jgi:hypothetical protein